ncbi:MAG: hypothetical protein II772_04440, partial [Lachnospiraceae bacterium]|nr:hypothetical protein [Lachnospiraceae bacterium]
MKKERSYMDSVHFNGRVWCAIMAVILIGIPFLECAIFRTTPDMRALLLGLIATAPMYWISLLNSGLQLDHTQLQAAIQQAATALATAIAGDCNGQYPAAAIEAYQQELTAAEAVNNKADD